MRRALRSRKPHPARKSGLSHRSRRSSPINTLGIERAFADVASKEFHGARAHLRAAAEHLTAGHSSDCIRESIHAVESVARSLAGAPSLAAALQHLEASAKVHPALKKGFGALYGFTSDEKGIRPPVTG